MEMCAVRSGKSLRQAALAVLFTFGAFAGTCFAQVFDSDNVVLLSHDDSLGFTNDVWGFVGTDGREYAIQGLFDGVAFWDVDDPVHPVLVGTIPSAPSIVRDMKTLGDYCYVVTEGGGGMQIIDLSDPTTPTLVNTWVGLDQVHNLTPDPARNLLFLSGGGNAGSDPGHLRILDLADPVNPVQVGEYVAPGSMFDSYVHDTSIEGTVAHLNHVMVGLVRIVDVSDPTLPVSLGTFADPTGWSHASAPLGDGIHLMAGQETIGGHVKVLDISDPTSITLEGTYNPFPTTSAHNPVIRGDRAYISWYEAGTRILDVSDPTLPVEIGYLDTSPPEDASGGFSGNWGVYPFASGTIAASDQTRGLVLLQYDPDAGVITGTVKEAGGGVPIEGAVVEYRELDNTFVTAADGAFEFPVFPGPSHTIVASGFFHVADSVTVSVDPDETVFVSFQLALRPTSNATLRMRDDGTSAPLENADVEIVGSSFSGVSDALGEVTFGALPLGTYDAHVRRHGYHIRDFTFAVVHESPTTVEVPLHPAAVHVDFSDGTGWTVQGSASAGAWTIQPAVVDSFLTFVSQPGEDHSTGVDNICAYTDPVEDVDGGNTRLYSPVYDLSGLAEPSLFYYRWYFARGGQGLSEDELIVRMSENGGGTFPHPIETATHSGSQWLPVEVDLTELTSNFASVQFRFRVIDTFPQETIEAALDDFTIFDAALGPVSVSEPPAPSGIIALAPGRPNPFRGETRIRFRVSEKMPVDLSVFDVRGARVARLLAGEMPAGDHDVVWDGRSGSGRITAAGIYFLRLETPAGVEKGRIVHLR